MPERSAGAECRSEVQERSAGAECRSGVPERSEVDMNSLSWDGVDVTMQSSEQTELLRNITRNITLRLHGWSMQLKESIQRYGASLWENKPYFQRCGY